jgi:hypothetical protein
MLILGRCFFKSSMHESVSSIDQLSPSEKWKG